MEGVRPAVANTFLFLAAAGGTIAIVSSIGWWQASRPRRVTLQELGLDDRQALVQEFFQVSPDVLMPAWYAPAIGYTLRPATQLTAWGDTFTSNELGYRTGPVPKEPGTLRVAFVGDSWTYGMGAKESESFPAQLERMANEDGRAPRRVEAWSLALPGYNLENELAALQAFFERLQPDAVVLGIHPNDVDTYLMVAPNGSWKSRSTVDPREGFGSDLAVRYPHVPIASYRYGEAWSVAFSRLHGVERWLRQERVPLLLFFVAAWNEPFVHHLVSASGVEAAYIIAPAALTLPPFSAPPPYGHGTPECYRHCARMVYRGLQGPMGFRPLDEEPGEIKGPVHDHPPAGDWEREAERAMDSWTTWTIPARFEPRAGQPGCVGSMDCSTGCFGSATTILVRKEAGSRRLTLRLERVPNARGLYPQELSVSIPSASGPNEETLTIPTGDGPLELEVPIPPEIRDNAAMDVELRASRASIAPSNLVQRSLFVKAIEQSP